MHFGALYVSHETVSSCRAPYKEARSREGKLSNRLTLGLHIARFANHVFLSLMTRDELNNDPLTQTDVMCHYLTVRSLLEAKEYNEALQVIAESEICPNITQSGITFTDHTAFFQDAPRNVSNTICVHGIQMYILKKLYFVSLFIVAMLQYNLLPYNLSI